MAQDGKIFIYNASLTNLKFKINDSSVTEDAARFVAGTGRELNWQAQLADETVDRHRVSGENQFGDGENTLYIYRDVLRDEILEDIEGLYAIEMTIFIEPRKYQLSEDLVVYLVYEHGHYGYFLIDDEGEPKTFQKPN